VHSWIREARFVVIDIDERVGAEAARLATRWQLSGSDAAILASAKLWNIPVLYTWDAGLLKVRDQIAGLSVTEPEIPPTIPEQVDFFRQ
jgi:predicted nucleic acid-binding protein